MDKGSFLVDNGKITSSGSFGLSTDNRSFKYGDGLFETMRAINGKLPFWSFHFQRLQSGLEILGIETKLLDSSSLEKSIIELLQHNEHTDSARVRLSVYRKGSGSYIPESNDLGFVIESWKLNQNEFKLNEKGKIVDLFTKVKKPMNLLSMVKSANALVFVLAGRFAMENKLDDALIVNMDNELCEATSSNIFMIKNSQIYTPPLSSGCLPGTMRMVLISMLAAKGIKVAETKISPSDLIMADEVFLTNSIDGIAWIGGYKNKRYYKKYAEILIKEVNNLYLNS